MAADPMKNPAPGGSADRAQMMRVLVPAGAVALIVVLVAVIAALSGGGRKMSDGSDGSADDPGLKTAAQGVRYRDLKEGDGEPAPKGGRVKVKYTGWLTDGTVFDDSKGAAVEFDLGGAIIPGWKVGIPGMKVGGIRKLVIAPEQAYGGTAQGKIPPGSTLIFEVELVSAPPPPRPRSPAPADLTRLRDGTSPTADDPGLKPIGTAGLMYRDIKEGDGPVAPNGATVVMDYTGWLLSNGSVFDSSWRPNREPLDMALAQLIAGWQQGVPGMKVGGIRKLVIPADLGYGDQPRPGIPPGSTLVFEIELLGVK